MSGPNEKRQKQQSQGAAQGTAGWPTIEKPRWPKLRKSKPRWIVKDNGCWEWVGATLLPGYGCLKVRGKTLRAHRFAFEVEHGPVAPGVDIHHRCHNRLCVNPDHLEALDHSAHTRKHRVLTDEQKYPAASHIHPMVRQKVKGEVKRDLEAAIRAALFTQTKEGA